MRKLLALPLAAPALAACNEPPYPVFEVTL